MGRIYTPGLVKVYDFLVSSVDFEAWIEYARQAYIRFSGLEMPAVVLDLACGTGNTTIPWAQKGCRVIGIDISLPMITAARQKAAESGFKGIEFYVQDMRSLKITGPVDLVTCYHDGLNYLTNEDDLLAAFKGVAGVLRPGGVFVFDLNAISWLANINCKAQESYDTVEIDEGWLRLKWHSYYDRQRNLWEIKIEGYYFYEEQWFEFKEEHRERGYPPGVVQELLTAAGLRLAGVFHPFTFVPLQPDSRRHFYIALR